jgi:hypothetical protein
MIDATPEPRIMPTSADRAITLFNQLWQSAHRLHAPEKRSSPDQYRRL